MGFIGVDVLYAVRDLSNAPARSTRHANAVTLACALHCSQRTVALTSQDNRSAAACVKYLEV